MPVEVSGPGVTVVVRLEGDVDLSMQAPLLCAFDVARGRTSGSVIVDCSHVDFVDSTAIGQLLNAARRVEADGHHLQLVHVPESMERLIKILSGWELLNGSTGSTVLDLDAADRHLVTFG
jgi:anti-anti-sigma factor